MRSPVYRLEQLTAQWTLRQFMAYFIALVVLAGVFALSAIDLVFTVGLVVIGVSIAGVASAVEIVRAYEKRALSVFGEYRGLLGPGLHFVMPFVSRTYRFDLRTQTLDVPPQEAITRDNSPVTTDAIVYIRVMDAKKAFLEVDDYRRATLLLAQTTLRAALGNMALDETLSQREAINKRIRAELDEPTDKWGVRIEAVEIRRVKPTQGVVSAMEQQSGAERRRRAMILEAQGERVSAIERAEGDKRANVIHAEGEKLAQILEAQGNAVSTVLGARAAESMGERAILDTGLETLETIGQNESNTFVFPQALTSLLGRYGSHLSGSDVQTDTLGLESQLLDPETRELLDLDSIEAMDRGGESAPFQKTTDR